MKASRAIVLSALIVMGTNMNSAHSETLTQEAHDEMVEITEKAMEEAQKKWYEAVDDSQKLVEKEFREEENRMDDWAKQMLDERERWLKYDDEKKENDEKLNELCAKEEEEKCSKETAILQEKQEEDFAKLLHDNEKKRRAIVDHYKKIFFEINEKQKEVKDKLEEALAKIQEELTEDLDEVQQDYAKEGIILVNKEIDIQQERYELLTEKIMWLEEEIGDRLCFEFEGDHRIMNDAEILIFNDILNRKVLKYLTQREKIPLEMRGCKETIHFLLDEAMEHRDRNLRGQAMHRHLGRRKISRTESTALYDCSGCPDPDPDCEGYRRSLEARNEFGQLKQSGLLGAWLAKRVEIHLRNAFIDVTARRVECDQA